MSKRKIVVIDRSGIIRFIDEKPPVFYLKTGSLQKTLEKLGVPDKMCSKSLQ